jgi:hypothetical protein
MPRVSLHRLAERELNDAALYYERESRGLGTIFLNDVENYIQAIARNPNAGVKIRGVIRRRLLRVFHTESFIPHTPTTSEYSRS